MKFTLRQLIYVQAAAKHLSIASAARKLRISKSSIVAALDEFEAQFSVNIFVRQPRKGLTLTPAGKQFIKKIERVIHHVETFERELSGHLEDVSGELIVGCFAPLAPHVLPSVIRALNLKFPYLTIRVIEGDLRFVSQSLANGNADIALTYDLGLPEGIEFEKLGEAPPYALFSADNPMSKEGRVSMKQLTELPVILLDLPESRTYFDLVFKSKNIRPQIAFRTGTYETLRGFVAAGLGYSILNLRPAIDYTYSGNKVYCVPISDKLPTPSIGIQTRPNSHLSQAALAFSDECRRMFSSPQATRLFVR